MVKFNYKGWSIINLFKVSINFGIGGGVCGGWSFEKVWGEGFGEI